MRPSARYTVLLLCLALLVTAVAATAAPSVLLRKPNGQQVVLPLTANSIEVDARTGEVIATPAASSGVVGDGWCPDQLTNAPVFSWPALSLRLPNGQRYRIPLASGTNPSWGALTTLWQVHTKASHGVPGDGWCPPIAAAPQFTLPLNAQPTLLVAGSETTLRWTAIGATACNTSGSTFPQSVTQIEGWGSTMPTESSGTRLRLNTVGIYRFRLTCQNGYGAISSEVSVTVSASDPVGSCTGIHAPPIGLTRQSSFVLDDIDLWAASNTDWLRFTQIDLTQWELPLPGHIDASGQVRSFLGRFGRSGGDTGTAEINRGQYTSFRIDTTGHANRAGQVSWEQPGTAGAPLLVTLSPCPGDFFPIDSRCKSNGSAASGLGWTTGPSAPTYCPLSAGAVFYLNVVFGSPNSPGQTTCPFAQCRWLFTQSCQAGCATP